MLRRVFSWRLLAAVCLPTLTSCSAISIQQVTDPRPSEIVDYISLFQPHVSAPIKTAGDYVWAGYAYVDQHCNNFFTALEQARMRSAFATDLSQAAFGAAGSVLTLLNESQKSIGIVAAAGTLTHTVLTSYANNYQFGQYSGIAEHAGSLWLQVTVAQNNYKFTAVAPLYNEIRSRELRSVEATAQAHNIVQNYARICSLQQLQAFIQTALLSKAAAPVTDPGAGGAGGRKEGILLGAGRARATPSMPAYGIGITR